MLDVIWSFETEIDPFTRLVIGLIFGAPIVAVGIWGVIAREKEESLSPKLLFLAIGLIILLSGPYSFLRLAGSSNALRDEILRYGTSDIVGHFSMPFRSAEEFVIGNVKFEWLAQQPEFAALRTEVFESQESECVTATFSRSRKIVLLRSTPSACTSIARER